MCESDQPRAGVLIPTARRAVFDSKSGWEMLTGIRMLEARSSVYRDSSEVQRSEYGWDYIVESAVLIERELLGQGRNVAGCSVWARGYYAGTSIVDKQKCRGYARQQEAEGKRQDSAPSKGPLGPFGRDCPPPMKGVGKRSDLEIGAYFSETRVVCRAGKLRRLAYAVDIRNEALNSRTRLAQEG